MSVPTEKIITGYAKMWPRAVFDVRSGKHKAGVKELLLSPGVYILYRDDMPYYIGKTANVFGEEFGRTPVDLRTGTTISGITFLLSRYRISTIWTTLKVC
jgi:hypothetical protein